jgi:hypothetical protein
MDATARSGDSYLVTKPLGETRPWSRAATIALAVFTLLIAGQLALWTLKVANLGGSERYIREVTDFRAILTGGLTIHDGSGRLLYDEATEHAVQARVLAPYVTFAPGVTLPNSHPPFESLLIAPLMDLPYAVPFALWTAMEILALGLSLWLLTRATRLDGSTRWLLIAAACAYQPVHAMLWTGQSSPLILLGFCGVYAGIKASREGWAGVALALIFLKPQLAVAIVLLLLLHRHWKPLVVAAGTWLGASVAVMPSLGIDWPLRYARYLAGSARWGAEHFEYPPGMYNWRGLAVNALGSVAPQIVAPAALALSAGSVGLLIWAWWQSHRDDTGQARQISDVLWALTAVVTLLIAQHLYPHDLLLLIFPAWLIVTRAASGNCPRAQSRGWLALVIAGFTLPLLTFMFAQRAGQAVIPTVVLMAITMGALAWTTRGRGSYLMPSPAGTQATTQQP